MKKKIFKVVKMVLVAAIVVGGISLNGLKENKKYEMVDALPCTSSCDITPEYEELPAGSYEVYYNIEDIIYNENNNTYTMVIFGEGERKLQPLCKAKYSKRYHEMLKKYFVGNKMTALQHVKDGEIWDYIIHDKYLNCELDELGRENYMNHICKVKADYLLVYDKEA